MNNKSPMTLEEHRHAGQDKDMGQETGTAKLGRHRPDEEQSKK